MRLIVPLLLSVLIVSVPPSWRVAPLATVTPEVLRRLLPVVARVPALTVVAPE